MLALMLPFTWFEARIDWPLYSLKILSTSRIGMSSKLIVIRRCCDCCCGSGTVLPFTDIVGRSAALVGRVAFGGARITVGAGPAATAGALAILAAWYPTAHAGRLLVAPSTLMRIPSLSLVAW